MSLAGRVALVTGSSRGIGRAIAERLAHDGANVVANYMSDAAAAEETVALVEKAGRRAIAVKADISDPAEVEALFRTAAQMRGALDVVVANAAVEVVDVPFTDYSKEQIDQVLGVNVRGTFLTLAEAARSVRNGGRIIVVSSNSVELSRPGFGLYGASKAAGRLMVEVLAKELGGRDITVNSVVPGVTQAAGVFTHTSSGDALFTTIAEQTPLRRVGTVADVANAVSFLAGPDSAFITGHHLCVDGGITA